MPLRAFSCFFRHTGRMLCRKYITRSFFIQAGRVSFPSHLEISVVRREKGIAENSHDIYISKTNHER